MSAMTAEARAIILVVDDDDDIRAVVRETLWEAGYSVVEAVNGKTALEFLVAHHGAEPALILLDLAMPVMTGWEFLEVVKDDLRFAQIPILISSASRPQPDAKTHGAIVGFLPKPFERDELLAKVRQTLDAEPRTDAARF